MPLRCKTFRLLILLLLAKSALAQGAAPARYGTWTAAASSSQVFRGSWSAQTLPRNPDEAQGSWTLINDSGDVVLQGTWSAKRTRAHGHGTWRAQTAQGQSFSGVWDADLADSKEQTLAGMLARTIEKEVAGSWRSGRYHGNWSLKGFKLKNRGH